MVGKGYQGAGSMRRCCKTREERSLDSSRYSRQFHMSSTRENGSRYGALPQSSSAFSKRDQTHAVGFVPQPLREKKGASWSLNKQANNVESTSYYCTDVEHDDFVSFEIGIMHYY